MKVLLQRRAVGLRVGRLSVYVWAGAWSWRADEVRLECVHCLNFYLGPFGMEWETPEREAEYARKWLERGKW